MVTVVKTRFPEVTICPVPHVVVYWMLPCCPRCLKESDNLRTEEKPCRLPGLK